MTTDTKTLKTTFHFIWISTIWIFTWFSLQNLNLDFGSVFSLGRFLDIGGSGGFVSNLNLSIWLVPLIAFSNDFSFGVISASFGSTGAG